MRIITSIAICACLQTATPAAASSSPCQSQRAAAARPAATVQCVVATHDSPQPAGVRAAVVKS